MSYLTGLSPTQLRRAADLQERILKLQDEFNAILAAPVEIPEAETAAQPKKRKFSAVVRAKMRKAQKESWAKIKGEETTPAIAPQPEEKPRKKFSAAMKARLSALAKARWAKVKKAGKKSL
jgi:hypothetical protein